MLQLQLWSADSLHVAFRNLGESQSWGRAVAEHQRENQKTFESVTFIIKVKSRNVFKEEHENHTDTPLHSHVIFLQYFFFDYSAAPVPVKNTSVIKYLKGGMATYIAFTIGLEPFLC